MLQSSPSLSVTSPQGAVSPPASSPRRRGLNYLRNYTAGRLSSNPAESPRPSPRSYFSRSISAPHTPPISPEAASRPLSVAPRSPGSRDPFANESLHADTASGDDSSTSARGLIPAARSLSRSLTLRPRSSSSRPLSAIDPESTSSTMARHRTINVSRSSVPETVQSTDPRRPARSADDAASEATRPARRLSIGDRPGTSADASEPGETKPQLPTIRFFPHQEMRNGRQSLNFAPIARTLPSESSIIRVGRYSEREGIPTANPTGPSDAPVGFKSKVVSRKHCEFSFQDGQWQIKDVCSSSGTFLNHIRLSQPNMESKLFPVKDGDIVQLGIDFRGGEEMIFRCVKIRIECNRSWQKRPNNFNMTRHTQLKNLGKSESAADDNSGECAICLNAVLPCQSLFVSACAHVWHYKCIRPLLEGKNSTYPQFQCPNCRAYTDLQAEVDVAEDLDMDEWVDNAPDIAEETEETEETVDPPPDEPLVALAHQPTADATSQLGGAADRSDDMVQSGLGIVIGGQMVIRPERSTSLAASALLARRQATNSTTPQIGPIRGLDFPDQAAPSAANVAAAEETGASTSNGSDVVSGEGPLTPRNNAGPFVFDGGAGRTGSRRVVISARDGATNERKD